MIDVPDDWLGAEAATLQPPEGKWTGGVPWIAGGIIVALAVAAYAIETKGPAALRRV
jgi:hypothetical protein